MRTNDRGVSPVIATILMVAITVVLAAVLYVMVTQLIIPPDELKPNVVLSSLNCEPSSCDGRVSASQPARALSQFRVTVTADGQRAIAPTALTAGSNISGGGLTFRYLDVGGEGRMTGGDTFRLEGIQAGVSYDVVFLWRDGAVVQSITFAI